MGLTTGMTSIAAVVVHGARILSSKNIILGSTLRIKEIFDSSFVMDKKY